MNISISPEAETRLRAKAAAAGVDVTAYATRQLELLVAPPRSLKEISGEVGEAFKNSGISEGELAAFLEAEKHKMRTERRRGVGGGNGSK
ncbi:MAG: hypothetical protein FWD61_05055 [Phycisphaerales bacterium]|nr:hypothetical protein [Phycisphaerales bacterium]